MAKKYDLLLCGVTGFTGKLAAEYLMRADLHHEGNPVKWAVCGRNETKIKASLEEAKHLAGTESSVDVQSISVEIVEDLVCKDNEVMFTKLKGVVEKTKVVISTVGPFDKYGHDLVRVCVELGVHYADITGETDFVRKLILTYGEKAKETGATIVNHCGHDCVPWDISVYELSKYAAKKLNTELHEVNFYSELSSNVSGGTTATLKHSLFEQQKDKKKNAFDPLLTDYVTGNKSCSYTEIRKFSSSSYIPEFDKNAETWVMAPVMGNCIKRSNALCHYAQNLVFSERILKEVGVVQGIKDGFFNAKFGLGLFAEGALGLPSFGLIPSSGDGPTREVMLNGYLKLYGRATLKSKKNTQINLYSS